MDGVMNPLKTNEYNPSYNINDIESYSFEQLTQLKKAIEDDLARLFTSLKNNKATMETPLVTADGFPRSDINIIEIRTLRILIIKLTNDSVVVRDRLMELLPTQFQPKEKTAASHVPFAVISEIQLNSPAHSCKLQENDKLVSISNINVLNHDNLKGLVKLVSSSKNVPLQLTILRDSQKIVELQLIPAEWEGRGLLGCKLTQI